MTNEARRTENHNPAYLLFVLAISVLALVLLAVSALPRLDPAVATIVHYADTALCALFLLDFLITLFRSRRKKRYLLRWGWLDLLSSIPVFPQFRVARLARVARVLRVLRGIRSIRILASLILERRAQSAIMSAAVIAILMLLFGSISILHFENVPGANIRGPQDAFWWSVATLTTGGLGELYPVTPEGRLVAILLLVCGVGLFGVLSGFFAAWFLAPGEKDQESEIAGLRKEIRELRESLRNRGWEDGLR